jgi:hypothetical protein
MESNIFRVMEPVQGRKEGEEMRTKRGTNLTSACLRRMHESPRLILVALSIVASMGAISVPLHAQQFSPIGPLSFTKVFNGANPLPQTLTVTSTGANFNFTYAATTITGGTWLSVDNVSFNACALCTMPQSIRVVVNANATLAAGTYTGQVVFTSQVGSITMTVPVSLTVAPAGGTFFDNLPGQVSFSLKSSGLTPPSQPIQIRNGGTGTLNWTLMTSTVDGGNWLSASALSGTATSNVMIGLVEANLPGQGITPGTFLGKLVFQSASGNVTVPVSVVVGQSVFTQLNAISFTKPFNGANPLPQILTGASTGTNFTFTANATTANGGAWLTVANASFNACALCTTPEGFQAVVTAGPTMAIGTYTGQIVFTARDGSQAITVPVILTITPGNVPFFDNLPGQVAFSLQTNGFAPPNQEIDIRNGGSSGILDWTATGITADGGNWLTISALSGAAPSRVSIGVSLPSLPGGGLAPGTFVGELIFQSAAGSVTVPVTVVVGDSVFRQVNAISFTKPVNGANPLPQTLVAASTGTNFQFTVSAMTATGGAWLSVVNASFNACSLCTTPESFQVVVNAGVTMAVGSYTAQIVFTARDGTQTLTVPVTLTVADPTAGPFFDNLPGQMSFSLQTGGAAPPSQTLQIRNAGSGTLSWTLDTSTADGGNWLNVPVQSGTAPSLVSVSVTKQNLPGQGLIAGTFVGELVFRTGGENVTVPVTVVVGDNVFRQVNAISFIKPVNGANPLPQTLTIASTGTDFTFTFSAATATGGNWLTVNNASFNACALCSTPLNLTAVVNAVVTMPVGTYTGQIVLTARDGTQTLTVPVTLTVADPTAGPFFDNLPGQMSFSLETGGATPPSQAVQIRNAGSGTLNWTLETSTSDGGNWLNVSALNGTAPSVVSVSITKLNLPGQGLIAGTFTGELVFRSGSQSITVPVSVAVGNNVFRQVNAISFVKPVGPGANPLPQTLTIASTGADFEFTFSAVTAIGGSWLTVENRSFNNCALCSTPLTLTAVVNAGTTMAVGTYTGQIVLTARDGTLALTVPVTLTVADPAAGPFFDNIPGQMSFSQITGSGNPPSRSIQLRNAGSGTLNWTVSGTTSDGGAWLTVAPASGVTPTTATVGVVTSLLPNMGLVPGVFIGELVFQAPGSSVTVPVSVHIGPSVFVQRPTLTFATPTAGTNPAPQTLDISSTATNIQFSVSTGTGAGGNWLSISTPASCVLCTTPLTATVSINSASLATGTYTGQVVITARDATEAMTVPVILMVGPSITSVTPNTGQAGTTLASLAIVGQNTNFVQGTTVASFGAGITVNSLTVNSATSATANITIQGAAVPGTRTVTITTGSEVATLPNGFTVTAATAVSMTANAGTTPQSATVSTAFANALAVTVRDAGNNPVAGVNVTFTAPGSGASGVFSNSTATITVATNSSGVAAAPFTANGTAGGPYAVAATSGALSASFSLTNSAGGTPATVVSYSVLFGARSFNLVGSTRTRLPWQIAGIQVVFSRPIVGGNVNSLSGVIPTGFTGLGTNTLTWTISPLSLGSFATMLAGSGTNALVDAAGNPLGGGAGFSQNLKVLWGDFNDDGVVSATDLVGVNNATVAPYNVFADINGDGVVNTDDVQVVRTRIGTSLP